MNRFRQQNTPIEAQPERPQPLRSFRYKAEGHDSSRRKGRFKAKSVYFLLLACVLVGMLGLLSIFYFKDRPERVAVSEGPVTFSSQSSFVEVSELLSAYLNTLGGRQALQDVRSVRYDGQVQFPSGQKDFQIWLLSPDKGMLVTDPGRAGGQRLILNGDLAWRVLEDRDGAREMQALDKFAKESLKWSLQVHHTFRRMALEGQSEGLTAKEVEFKDKPCYEISKTMPNGSDFLAILDKETLYLLKMVETLRVGDEQNEFTVLYDDYRMVAGVVEPYSTTLYKNGELDNEVSVRSIQINSGVMSSLFEVPDDLIEASPDISSRG